MIPWLFDKTDFMNPSLSYDLLGIMYHRDTFSSHFKRAWLIYISKATVVPVYNHLPNNPKYWSVDRSCFSAICYMWRTQWESVVGWSPWSLGRASASQF